MNVLGAMLSLFRTTRPPRPAVITRSVTPITGYGVIEGPPDMIAAEVDSEKQRYSVARYVAMMRSVYLGEPEEMTAEDRERFEARRSEFERYIQNLPPDEQTAFFKESDGLIAEGKLWTVLTPQEVEEARQRVLARKDEIQRDAARPMGMAARSAIAPELRNSLVIADRMPTEDELLGLPSFPDIGDDDEEEDEDQG